MASKVTVSIYLWVGFLSIHARLCSWRWSAVVVLIIPIVGLLVCFMCSSKRCWFVHKMTCSMYNCEKWRFRPLRMTCFKHNCKICWFVLLKMTCTTYTCEKCWFLLMRMACPTYKCKWCWSMLLRMTFTTYWLKDVGLYYWK